MKKILMALFLLLSFAGFSQTLTDIALPQFVQGVGSADPALDRKVPYVCRMQVNGLLNNTTYRYYSRFGNAPTGNTGLGAYIIANQTGNFTRVTAPSLAAAGSFGEFTTNASGSYTGWFINEPTSDIAFAPGSTLYFRLFLNNGAGGNAVVTRITSPSPVTVLGWGAAATQGSGLRSTNAASYTAKNFVMLYDNVAGTGRPLTGALIESDGTVQGSALNGDPFTAAYAPFYGDLVDGVNGAWGTIIPNNLANGVGNITQYSLATGALVNSCTSATGAYGATNTANANVGLAALNLSCTPTAPPLSAITTSTGVACFGGSIGSITVAANAGTGPYSFALSGTATANNTTGVFTGLAAGPYTIVVTDAAAGSVTVTATVGGPSAALVAAATPSAILCNGGTSSVVVSATGGTAPYTGTGTFVANTGAYTYTVTDANSCTNTVTGTITAPTAVVVTAPFSPIITAGGSTTVNVAATGGTGPYTGTGAFVRTAGTYTFTVTDANSCTGSITITINQPGPLVVTSTFTPFTCAGTATVTVSATGGVAPYSGTGLKVITAAGPYSFIVNDAQGATATATGTIAPATGCPTVSEVLYPKFVQGVGTQDPADDRKVPFAARMTISGLTPNATYRYFSRFTPNRLESGNETGAYIIANQTGNFRRVTAPNLSQAGAYGTLTADASGNATDWFIVEPSSSSVFTPGTQLYWRIMLNNGAGGTAIANRATAVNAVTVLGFGAAANQGTGVRAAANTAYTPKNFIMLYNNEAGTGRPEAGTFIEKDGTDNSSALNGDPFNTGYAPFYGVSVDTVNNTWGTIIPNNLATGIRNITQYTLATGAFVNNCTSTNGTYGTAVTAVTTGGLTEQVIACTPFAASVTADPAVGQMNFVTLANASQIASTLLFTQNYNLRVPFYNLNQTNVVPNGTIKVTVDLGTKLVLAPGFNLATAPLSNYFAWTSTVVAGRVIITGTQIATIPEDFASTLIFQVAGSLSCSSSIATNISIVNTLSNLVDEDLQNNAATLQYNLPVTVTSTQVNVTCNGLTNGKIRPIASPGTTVVIRNAANVIVDTIGLAPGVYTITATATGDAGNTCTATSTVTIVQPSVLALGAGAIVNNTCNGGNLGTVTVIPTGGTAPYSYTIAGPTVNTSGASSGTFTNLLAGAYVITVTDANGCSATRNATVTQPTGVAPDISLGSDYTGSIFTAPGVTQTIVYNVTEIAGNPAVGDTIRITRVAGFTINFNVALFSTTVGTSTYTLDNSRWKIDNSDPQFVSIILTDPSNATNPGTILCNQLVRVAVSLTRNTPDVSTFTLSARLRRANGELNLTNNLNSIILAAD